MKNRIVAIAFILPMSLVLSALSERAGADETCREILARGFYDQYSKTDGRVRDRVMYAELCSLDYPQAMNTIKQTQKFGSDRSLGLWYGLVNLDDGDPETAPTPLANTISEERFTQWKGGYCSRNLPVESAQAAEFLMHKIADRKPEFGISVVDAQAACLKKRQGLTCWATPATSATPDASQRDDILLNVNWNKAGPAQSQAQPEVAYSFLTRGAVSKFAGAPPKRALPAGYKLSPGTLQIPVTRPADAGIFASLKVNHEGTEHSCKVFIPGERDFQLSEPFVNRLKIKYPG